MRDDPITLLERELVDAARRRAVVADERAGSSHEPRGPWPALRPARRRRSLGSFTAVMLSGLAVAIALGALLALHGHEPPARPAPAAHQVVPGRRQLIDILAVLRRPQAKADLRSPAIARLLAHGPELPGMLGTADLSLVRRAAVTPWGSGVFLIPVKPSPQSRGAEAISLFVDSGGGCCATAADIERYGETTTEGAGRSFAGGSTQSRLVTVVPDGVRRVVFYFSPQAIPAGGPVYRQDLEVAAWVHGNIAAVQVPRQCCAGGPAQIWQGADGRVIKRIGNFSPPSPPPQPGPETALSRAAERNPSTPNRVWVTPTAGGPRTTFSVHFRLLLTDADYKYRIIGTPCPQYTFAGGGGGGAGDIRGRIWSESLNNVRGQALCPGTYHVSVSVMDLGRYGNLKHPARPFGTATFRVSG